MPASVEPEDANDMTPVKGPKKYIFFWESQGHWGVFGRYDRYYLR